MTLTPLNRPDILDLQKAVGVLWGKFIISLFLMLALLCFVVVMSYHNNDFRFLLLLFVVIPALCLPVFLASKDLRKKIDIVGANDKLFRSQKEETKLHETPQ